MSAQTKPTLHQLRQQHPQLTFEAFSCSVDDSAIRIRIHLTLEPDIEFTPELLIPIGRDVLNISADDISLLAFHLGLIETLSYWKAACPPRLIVKAGHLDPDQITWWKDLYLHGLGQFYFENDIDFSDPDLLTIVASGVRHPVPQPRKQPTGDLALAGGGKDSSVSLEIIKSMDCPVRGLVLNPIRSAVDGVTIAGLDAPLVIRRTIDSKLLKLNAAGYLNGHTPFSAYLAFLGVSVATILGYRNVIVANERSADEENVFYRGLAVNHQYSKSFRFEKRFREYSSQYLSTGSEYFSLLRPLYDLQITSIFSGLTRHHRSFRSCNVGQKTDSWCGHCPKCTFVYLSLFPFLSAENLVSIFGVDLLLQPTIHQHLRGLVGLNEVKPLECVGTRREAALAVQLGIQKCQDQRVTVPPVLTQLMSELSASQRPTPSEMRTWRDDWTDEHFLPAGHHAALKEALRSAPSAPSEREA